jgi:hypothetical protein
MVMFLLLFVGFFQHYAHARRYPPPELSSIEYEKLIIVPVLSLSKYYDKTHNYGAYIEIWDKQSRTLLWWIQVYKFQYIEGVEKDIQNVHISNIELQDGMVFLKNELDMIFTNNLDSKKVNLYKDLKVKSNWLPKIDIGGQWGTEGS